jgi:ArsR family transcriptional regulator, arsenate/arsenite/antimonite-responsive transcriptional repressor
MARKQTEAKALAKSSAKKVPIKKVAATFTECKPLFFAMGEQVRQDIILALAQVEELNVSQLADTSTLSRPAISHHLKILRQAGLIGLRREGTENFYRLTIEGGLGLLTRFIDEVEHCED